MILKMVYFKLLCYVKKFKSNGTMANYAFFLNEKFTNNQFSNDNYGKHIVEVLRSILLDLNSVSKHDHAILKQYAMKILSELQAQKLRLQLEPITYNKTEAIFVRYESYKKLNIIWRERLNRIIKVYSHQLLLKRDKRRTSKKLSISSYVKKVNAKD